MPLFLIIVTIVILHVFYMRVEASLVEVTRVFHARPGSTGLKLVHLSDIHAYLLRVSPKRIQMLIDRENPDAVIITGDCIERESHIPAFLNVARLLAARHSIYLCPGNHDLAAFRSNPEGLKTFFQDLRNLGVNVLINSSVCIETKKGKYNLIGIDDLRCGNPDISKAMSAIQKDARANIAFAHNPDTVFLFKDRQVDYLLCGHFHGGQIWTPFKLEFKTLRDDKLCRMGITRGMHRIKGINLYINRGLGNVVFPLRFLSRPEIAVLYLP
jgi:predicted MPP superfamily phosphohydrolase